MMPIWLHITTRWIIQFVCLFGSLFGAYLVAKSLDLGAVSSSTLLLALVLGVYFGIQYLFKNVITPSCPECGGTLVFKNKGYHRRIIYKCVSCSHKITTNFYDSKRRR
jgi:hypothetical protein